MIKSIVGPSNEYLSVKDINSGRNNIDMLK